jgi:hypothetical protein
VKPFARGVVTPTLSDICATTASSAPKPHFATFGISLQVLCRFAWHCGFGSPVPLLSRGRALAVFMPCGAQPVVRFSVALCLSRSPPSRFYRSKSYFRHLDNGSLSLNFPAHTIRPLAIQPAACGLTLSLSTTALTMAPQGGLANAPERLCR